MTSSALQLDSDNFYLVGASWGGILAIGARHDTMDPAHMERMAKQLPRALA